MNVLTDFSVGIVLGAGIGAACVFIMEIFQALFEAIDKHEI